MQQLDHAAFWGQQHVICCMKILPCMDMLKGQMPAVYCKPHWTCATLSVEVGTNSIKPRGVVHYTRSRLRFEVLHVQRGLQYNQHACADAPTHPPTRIHTLARRLRRSASALTCLTHHIPIPCQTHAHARKTHPHGGGGPGVGMPHSSRRCRLSLPPCAVK